MKPTSAVSYLVIAWGKTARNKFILYRKFKGKRRNRNSNTYSPYIRRWSLLVTWWIRMYKTSCWMTCCYYPSWKHSHIAVARYPPLEILYVFSLHVIAEECVVTTSSGPLIPPIASSPQQRNAPGTPPPNPPRKIILWSVVCTSNSFLTISCMLRTQCLLYPWN